MKRYLSALVLAALCTHLQAQIDDMYLGDGAEPSITFNRSAATPRVVMSYISWDASGGWTPIKYRFSGDGQAFAPAVDLHTQTFSDPTLTSNWATGAIYAAWISSTPSERFSFKKSNSDLEGFPLSAQLLQAQGNEALDRPWIAWGGTYVYASYLRQFTGTPMDPDVSAPMFKRGLIGLGGAVSWTGSPVRVPSVDEERPYAYSFSCPIAPGSSSNRAYIVSVRYKENAENPDPPNELRLFKTTNSGSTWTQDTTFTVNLYYGSGAWYYDGRDRQMTDYSVSGDTDSSNVYVFYVRTENLGTPGDGLFGGSDYTNTRFQSLYCRRSSNNGDSWEAPVKVFSLPMNQWPSRWATVPAPTSNSNSGFYRIGRVWSAVSPDGTVHVVWYDNRQGYGDTRLNPELDAVQLDKWTLHRAVSRDNGATWTVKPDVFSNPSLGGVAIPGQSPYTSWWQPPGETLGVDASNDKLYIVAPDSSTYLTDAPDKPQILYEMIDKDLW